MLEPPPLWPLEEPGGRWVGQGGDGGVWRAPREGAGCGAGLPWTMPVLMMEPILE